MQLSIRLELTKIDGGTTMEGMDRIWMVDMRTRRELHDKNEWKLVRLPILDSVISLKSEIFGKFIR